MPTKKPMDTTIVFRAQTTLRSAFERKYPNKGRRSKVLRGLLQMHLDGSIPTVRYFTPATSASTEFIGNIKPQQS